jgi:membrane protein
MPTKPSIGLRTLIRHGVCAARYWNSDNATNIAATLAFYSAFSLAPLLIIILTTTGWIVGSDAAYAQMGTQLNGLFGQTTAKILLEAAKSSQQATGLIATIISIVTLLIGATTVLAALQQALDQIWQSSRLARTGVVGWVVTRFLSLGFILALGFLLLVSLTISTGLAGVRTRVAHAYPTMVAAVAALDFTVSLLLVAALFAAVYRYMPAKRLPWRVVLVGGLLTAVLFDVGRWGVSLYLAHSTQPSAFGAASSFAALLLWLYYTALIFLFGAEFTACLGKLRDEAEAPAGSVPAEATRRAANGPTAAVGDFSQDAKIKPDGGMVG